MANMALPLWSSTVAAVFDQFLKKLKDENVLNDAAYKSLEKNLREQKIDYDSLRKAIFESNEPSK